MKKLILLLFLLVIISTYTLFQQKSGQQLNEQNINTVINSTNINEENKVKCTDLLEFECRERKDCRAIYGPSHCSGTICTSDYVFKNCFENK